MPSSCICFFHWNCQLYIYISIYIYTRRCNLPKPAKLISIVYTAVICLSKNLELLEFYHVNIGGILDGLALELYYLHFAAIPSLQ